MRITKERERECKERIRELVKPGDTVRTILRHVSRSGMYRAIDLYVIRDGDLVRLSGYASDLLEGYDSRREACRASGCGMDMGFHLVYNLGYTLYPEYECPGERCMSPDHYGQGANPRGSGMIHRDGYALKQEWV